MPSKPTPAGSHFPNSPSCTATVKKTGKPCTQPAMRGTNVCRVHGGKSGRVQAAAARRLEAAEARRQVTQLGLSQGMGQIDPRDALELELWRTHVQVMLYQSLVDELGHHVGEDGIAGKMLSAVGGRDSFTYETGEARPHVFVVLRDAERDRLARVAVAAAKAGVEDRRITLEEQRGQLIYAMLRAGFTELDVPLDRALPVAARHLRLLASGEQEAA